MAWFKKFKGFKLQTCYILTTEKWGGIPINMTKNWRITVILNNLIVVSNIESKLITINFI